MNDFKWWALPIFWVAVIFGFSSQSADEQEMEPFLSQYVPLDLLRPLLNKIEFTYYHSTRSVETMGLEPFAEFLIRKLAHFGVYLILAIFIYIAVLKTLDTNEFTKVVLSYFLLIHFAISDELSQSFSPGRTPYYGDVAIDAFGGLVGLITINVLLTLFFKKQKVNLNSYNNHL